MASKKNKIPKTKFNQGGEKLYIEDYKTLRKELMRTQINGKILCSWVEIIYIAKNICATQAIYRISAIFIKILTVLYQTMLKFV